MTYEEISRIPLEYLTNVELNDGTLPGSPHHDPSTGVSAGRAIQHQGADPVREEDGVQRSGRWR